MIIIKIQEMKVMMSLLIMYMKVIKSNHMLNKNLNDIKLILS